MEAGESDMVSELEEASRTTYVRNRWVYNPDNAGELQYTIVAPSLPGSGSYSAYNDWGIVSLCNFKLNIINNISYFSCSK